MTTWRSLSDAQLRARLRQRGVDYDRVEVLIRCRERPSGAEAIERVLGES